MTKDEIISMAREAGFDSHDMSADFTCNLNDIERFAALAMQRFTDVQQEVDCYGDGNVYRGQRNSDSKTQTININEMAREAGIFTGGHPMNPWSVYPSDLERFAALVAAAEREECAKVCESAWPEMHKYWGPGQARAACTDLAAAIRARGEE